MYIRGINSFLLRFGKCVALSELPMLLSGITAKINFIGESEST